MPPIQKLGGMEALDAPYLKLGIRSMVQKRAPWLVILFFSEMLTTTAMGFFEAEIAKAVVLALFLPLIISSGGNSGASLGSIRKDGGRRPRATPLGRTPRPPGGEINTPGDRWFDRRPWSENPRPGFSLNGKDVLAQRAPSRGCGPSALQAATHYPG